MTEIFATGIQMGESPRWHDGRFWMCDWLAGEVLAFSAAGEREVVAPRRGAAVLDRLAARRPPRGHHQRRRGRRAGARAVRRCGRAVQRDRGRRRGQLLGGHARLDAVGGARSPAIVAVVRPDGSCARSSPTTSGSRTGWRSSTRPTLVVAESHADRLTAWTIGADGTLDRPPGLGAARRGRGAGRHLRRRVRGDLVRLGPPAALRPSGRGRRGARDRRPRTGAASRACSAATTAGRCTSSRTTTARRAPRTGSCSPTASTYRGPAGPELAL